MDRTDEKGKHFTEIVSKDAIQVTIQTAAQLLRGWIRVRAHKRLKDSFNEGPQFLVVTRGVIMNKAGEEQQSFEFLALNRDHIVRVIPEEERKPQDRQGPSEA